MRSTRLAAVALAAAALAGVTACGSSGSPKASSSSSFYGAELSQPLTAPAGSFTSTTGSTYDLAAHLAGKVTLVYFGYTNCPDVCPATMAELGAALRQLPSTVSSQVQVVFITSDPARDTVKQMTTWLANFDDGVPNKFIGLTSDVKTADAYGAKLGVPLYPPTVKDGTYEVDHGAQVIGFGKDAKANLVWLPDGTTTQQYESDLTKLAAA